MAEQGYELFRRLMPPAIWREISDDDLVYVIPDAGMNGLPLEALIVQKPPSPNARDCTYWLDQGPAICYGPSATALIKLYALWGNSGAAHRGSLLIRLSCSVIPFFSVTRANRPPLATSISASNEKREPRPLTAG